MQRRVLARRVLPLSWVEGRVLDVRLVRNFTTEAGTAEDIGFVATDLASALDVGRQQELSRRLDPDQKGVYQMHTPGGAQSLTVISESGQKGMSLIHTLGGLNNYRDAGSQGSRSRLEFPEPG